MASRQPTPEIKPEPPAARGRVPMVVPLKSKDGTFTEGSLVTNGFVELKKKPRVLMRPGMEVAADALFTPGQGIITAESSTTTSLITVSGGKLRFPPVQLLFNVQPTDAGLGSSITPAVVVWLANSGGTAIPSATDNVTMSLGDSPSGAALSGTLTQTAVAGVATFSDLSVDKFGDYTLIATAAGRSKESNTFSVTATLVFTQQPIDADPTVTISPAVVVTVTDSGGNTVTGFTGDVTLSIGTNPSGGVLSGTLTVAAVAGVATFSNLSIDLAGTGYTLLANADVLDESESDDFNIATARLVTITGGTSVNVYTQALAAYADAHTATALYRVKVTGAVTTLTWDSTAQFPAGATFRLITLATVYGLGGNGGDTGRCSAGAANGTAGTAGGNALALNGKTVSINNGSGKIFGGGGGGGGGGYSGDGPTTGGGSNVGMFSAAGGGGGGAGGAATTGGSGIAASLSEGLTVPANYRARLNANTNSAPFLTDTVGTVSFGLSNLFISQVSTDGSAGGTSGAGNGGVGTLSGGTINSPVETYAMSAGNGGNGGTFGAAGVAGTIASSTADFGSGPVLAGIQGNGGAAGAAGKAINLGGGTATFTSGNTAARVKGAVS